MGLLVHLRSDVLMTGEAESRLRGLQKILFLHGRMDRVAAVAGIACKLMPVHIPECQNIRIFMAGEAFRIPILWVRFSAEDKNGHASSPALFNVLGTGAMA